jgi:16S rRNA (adenine1518-N6/adenine1519-N6)-dimethyltransferase
MEQVRAKKSLGQHFLKDLNIARKIAQSVETGNFQKVLEIGPGMGVLTQYLLERTEFETWAVEIDTESVAYLNTHFPQLENRLISGDFLRLSAESYPEGNFAVAGNFPYNISSPIFFKILEHRNRIPQVVCMLQKEVAVRLAASHGSKDYGILSVLLQTFYDIEYLFTVNENVFSPPPKVKSGVIRLKRNTRESLPCDEKFFFTVVKTAFNQRRKTLNNNLKPLGIPFPEGHPFAGLRVEQLSVADFIQLAADLETERKRLQNK